MKKIIFYTIFLILLFFFLNVKKVETENFISMNYNEQELYNQGYFSLKVYDFNITDLNILKKYNLDIISITPSKNIYNINIIKFNNKGINQIINQSIDYYISNINQNYEDNISYIKNNGFNIYSIKVFTTNYELIKLEKEINFKILSA